MLDGMANDDSDIAQEAFNAIDEYPLCIEKRISLKIQLSTGGPGDWLEAIYDGPDLVHAEYHFNDWFDHAEMDVEEEETIRFIQYFAEVFIGE